MEDRSKVPLLGTKLAIVAAVAPLVAVIPLSVSWASDLVGPWAGQRWVDRYVYFVPVVLFAAVTLVALARRLADWGVPWLGYICGVFLIGAWDIFGEHIIPPQPYGPTTWDNVLFAVGLLLAYVVVVVFVARRGWRRAGVLAFGVGGMLHLFWVGTLGSPARYPGGLSLLAIPIGFLDAFLLGFYVRGTDRARVAALALLAVVTFGTASVCGEAWNRSNIEDPALPLNILDLFLVQVVLMGAAPFLAFVIPAFWRWGRRLVGAMHLRRVPRPT